MADAADVSTIAVASGLSATAAAALAKVFIGKRKVDKVDAVAAISEAYKGVIHRLEKQLDEVQKELAEVRAEGRRKDAMLERLIEKLATAATSVPAVAVVAPHAERHVRHSDAPAG